MKIKRLLRSVFKKGDLMLGEVGDKGIGKRAIVNKSGLCGFHYHYDGMIGDDSYTYKVLRENDKTFYIFESRDFANKGLLKVEIEEKILYALYDLYLKYNVARWDGYNRYNTEISDGCGFRIKLYFKDGASLSASGTNAFPEDYKAFINAMHQELDPIRAEIINIKMIDDLKYSIQEKK